MEIMTLRRIVGMCAVVSALTVGAGIPVVAAKRGDKGFSAFFYVLAPGLLSVLMEMMLSETGPDAGFRPTLVNIARAARISMGPAWLTFCHVHYKLILRGGGLPFYRSWLGLNAVSGLLCIVSYAWPAAWAFQERSSSLVLSTSLFYAGGMAFAVLTRTKALPLSSWAGIACAGLSMVYYPFIALSEAFGLRFRHFSPEYPLSLQVFPFYLTCVCLIVAVYLLKTIAHDTGAESRTLVSAPSNPRDPPPGLLTPRETDVYRLIAEGHGAAAIADRLCVSVSTVKTHARSIYSKTGLGGRHKVMARYGRSGPDYTGRVG